MLVHLQVHSHYSLRQSLIRIPQLIEVAQERGLTSIALTDSDGLYGAVAFTQAAQAAGIHPILGAELSVGGDRLTLLARNQTGYHHLCRLITQRHLQGPLPLEAVLEKAEGLVLLTGGEKGALPRLLRKGMLDEARKLLLRYREGFGEWVYAQIGPLCPQTLIGIAQRTETPIVAAQEARYLHPQQEREWRSLLKAYGQGHWLSGPRHLALDLEGYREIPGALSNIQKIAEACDFALPLGGRRLPKFEGGEDLLTKLCQQGLTTRYPGGLRLAAEARLQTELKVILAMGLADYFLIAWDLVQFAKARGIPVMPRGSAAGSLVLYLLGISEICPIQHHLCFERFLNPERKGLPDIDLDFDWQRRDEVVEYCAHKYGYVARISTHQHLGPRGAGKVAERTQEMNPELLEGAPDHLGIHPCGIVVSATPIEDWIPLELSHKGPIVTQFEMTSVEALGFLKMDLLCNRNLSILSKTLARVGRRFDELSLDDAEAFALLQTGRTMGIYQLESGGVQTLLKHFKPTTLEDLMAITSLHRPGPIESGITPRYIQRRYGKEEVEYPDPCLKEVLAHTYGTILYQEQCLQVAQVFAGLSLGAADSLRRAISKRDRSGLETFKQRFFEGACELGRDPQTTEEVFKILTYFGGYGFVKAHAASCASLAVREAALKARFPLEFLASVLSSGQGYYPPRMYIEDARTWGGKILPPCIQASKAEATTEQHGLRIGFSQIKGLSHAGIKSLLQAQKAAPFQNLWDLWQRTALDIKEVETLIRIGACDALGKTRPTMLLQVGELKKRDRHALTLLPIHLPEVALPDYPALIKQEIERELLGFTIERPKMPMIQGTVPLQEATKTHQRVRVVADILSWFGHRTKNRDKMAFWTLSDGISHLQGVVFPKVYQALPRPLHGPLLLTGIHKEDAFVIERVEVLS